MNKKTSDTEMVPGANPALQARNDGAVIRRDPVPLTPSGNPVGFYPYSTFVGGRQPEPKAPGEAKPEHKPADLTKLKPATVKRRETVIKAADKLPARETVIKAPVKKQDPSIDAAALGCYPGKIILEGPALDAAVKALDSAAAEPSQVTDNVGNLSVTKPYRPWAQKQ